MHKTSAPEQALLVRVVESDAPAAEPVVADLMTREVVCVAPDLPVATLVEVLLARGISGAPVVDARGAPIGVVSKTDVLGARGLLERRGPLDDLAVSSSFDPAEPRCAREVVVGDVMTPLVFALREDAPLSHAAALLAYEGVHRAPVVSDDGRVVGILSSMDVLRWVGAARRA